MSFAAVQVFNNWAAYWSNILLRGWLHRAFVAVLEIKQGKLQTGFLLCSILLGKLITVKDKSCAYTIN